MYSITLKSNNYYTYKDKYYHFSYPKYTYTNITNPYTEYMRHKLWENLLNFIQEYLKQNNIILKKYSQKSIRYD